MRNIVDPGLVAFDKLFQGRLAAVDRMLGELFVRGVRGAHFAEWIVHGLPIYRGRRVDCTPDARGVHADAASRSFLR